MGERVIERFDQDSFMAWEVLQPEKHELIDGLPVMMTGASRRHGTMTINVLAELRAKLRGQPCRPANSDTALKLPNGNVRRPDAMVDCPNEPDDRPFIRSPVLIVEVISKSTAFVDQYRKLEEYKRLPSLQWYLMLFQDAARATLVARVQGDVWETRDVIGLGSAITFEAIGVELAMADLYENVDVEA